MSQQNVWMHCAHPNYRRVCSILIFHCCVIILPQKQGCKTMMHPLMVSVYQESSHGLAESTVSRSHKVPIKLSPRTLSPHREKDSVPGSPICWQYTIPQGLSDGRPFRLPVKGYTLLLAAWLSVQDSSLHGSFLLQSQQRCSQSYYIVICT